MPPKAIEIEISDPDYKQYGASIGLNPKLLTKFINEQVKAGKLEANAGDVIFTGFEYRNNGKYMWDGKKAINLYTGVDDYGSVPPVIQIGEDNDFLPGSWIDLIDHNEFIWFSKSIVSKLKFKANKEDMDEPVRAEVVIRKQKYVFIVESFNGKEVNPYDLTENDIKDINESVKKGYASFFGAGRENGAYNIHVRTSFLRQSNGSKTCLEEYKENAQRIASYYENNKNLAMDKEVFKTMTLRQSQKKVPTKIPTPPAVKNAVKLVQKDEAIKELKAEIAKIYQMSLKL